MNKPPRDMNAGLIAQLLSDSGAFGFEIDACMAYAYDGEIEFLAFSQEDECVSECLRRYNLGNVVSDFEYFSEHIGGDESKEDAINKACEKFEQDKLASFEAQVEAFESLEFVSHESQFATYFESLSDPDFNIIEGILGIGLQRKWISKEFAEKWRQPQANATAGKRFYGFAYTSGDNVKYYIDAYLPNVWKKWRTAHDAGAIVIGGIEGSEPIFQLRKKFEERLKNACDKDYLALLSEGAPSDSDVASENAASNAAGRNEGSSNDKAPGVGDSAAPVDESAQIKFDVILASASPRRSQLLSDAGVEFVVHVAEVDETLEPDLQANPVEAVKKLAERKAGAVVQEILATEGYVGSVLVIGADTMVVHDGKIFGKPHSSSEGKHMLRVLSGDTHQVHTGVSVWLVHAPADQDISLGYRTLVDTTDVTFKTLSDSEIDEYLRKGESYDKAGAYAIQGEGAALVDHIDGLMSTVIGLPIERLLDEFPDIKR